MGLFSKEPVQAVARVVAEVAFGLGRPHLARDAPPGKASAPKPVPDIRRSRPLLRPVGRRFQSMAFRQSSISRLSASSCWRSEPPTSREVFISAFETASCKAAIAR